MCFMFTGFIANKYSIKRELVNKAITAKCNSEAKCRKRKISIVQRDVNNIASANTSQSYNRIVYDDDEDYDDNE